MRKHRYLGIVIPLVVLSACGFSKEEDPYRTPDLFYAEVCRYFGSHGNNPSEGSSYYWKCITTTKSIKNEFGYCDFTGKIKQHLKEIEPYEEIKEIKEKDENYFTYTLSSSGIGEGQSITVYDNGYVEIKSGHGLQGVGYYYYSIDPELAKTIHDSVDGEIKSYLDVINEEEKVADKILDSSNFFAFIPDAACTISLYDKDKGQYSSKSSVDDKEALKDCLASFKYSYPSDYPQDYSNVKFRCEFKKGKRTLNYDLYDSYEMVLFRYEGKDELGVTHIKQNYKKINKEDGQTINDYLLEKYKNDIV